MRSSEPNFYSSSDSDESSDPFSDDNDEGGINQIINGVKNHLNLSSSKSQKSEKSKTPSRKNKPKSGQKQNHKVMPYNNIRPLNGQYDDQSDYSSDQSDDDSDSSSSGSSDSGASTDDSSEHHTSINEKEDKGNESTEDYSDDDDEGEDGYKPGGYHRVTVGEVYNQR